MDSIPKGSIVYKNISNKKYLYLVFRNGKKINTKYIKKDDLAELIEQLEERKQIGQALKNINHNLKVLNKIR